MATSLLFYIDYNGVDLADGSVIGYIADTYVAYGLMIPLVMLELFSIYMAIRPHDKQALTNRKAYIAISTYFIHFLVFLAPLYMVHVFYWQLPFNLGKYVTGVAET